MRVLKAVAQEKRIPGNQREGFKNRTERQRTTMCIVHGLVMNHLRVTFLKLDLVRGTIKTMGRLNIPHSLHL